MWKSVHGCEFLCPFCRSVDEFLLHTLFVCKHAEDKLQFLADKKNVCLVFEFLDYQSPPCYFSFHEIEREPTR